MNAVDENAVTEGTNLPEVASKDQKSDRKVTMTDGRIVNFNSRNKLIKENSRNPETVKDEVYLSEDGSKLVAPLRINCSNGEFFTADVEVPVIKGHVHIPVADAEFLLRLARHGKSQKISDAVTKPESDEDLVSGVQRAIQQMNDKIWTQQTGGDGSAGLGDFIEACRRIKGLEKFVSGTETLSPEFLAFRTALLAKDPAVIKMYKANPEISAEMAAIRSEREAAKAAKLRGATPEQSAQSLLDF